MLYSSVGMAKLLRLIPEPVAQQALEAVIGLDTQIRSLKAMRDEKCRDLIERLLSGSPVEPGRRCPEIRHEAHGPRRTVHLVIDGRPIK